MRKSMVLFFVSLVCCSISLKAQDKQITQKLITVFGSVELKERADQASLVFSVKGVGSSLRLAVEDANAKVKTIAEKLIALGVKGNDVSTSEFYSQENLGDKAFLSSSRDYRAIITTLVKIDSLKLLEAILYAVSESGVERLSDIAFSLKDELSFRRRARIAAAEKAREKAQDMLNGVGAALGGVVSIEEIQLGGQPQLFIRGGRAGDYPNPFNPPTEIRKEAVDESRGSGFFAQTLSITSQVRAIFEIK